jgi:hypothetical protein
LLNIYGFWSLSEAYFWNEFEGDSVPSDEPVLYGADLWTDMILDAAEPLSLYDFHTNIVCRSWAAIVGVISGTAMIRCPRVSKLHAVR